MDTNVLVSVARKGGRDLESVSADLTKAGMTIIDVLKYTGVVTGTIADASKMEALRRVPGVSAVEVDREFSAGG